MSSYIIDIFIHISVFLYVPTFFTAFSQILLIVALSMDNQILHFNLVFAKSSCSLKVSSISVCASALRKFRIRNGAHSRHRRPGTAVV